MRARAYVRTYVHKLLLCFIPLEMHVRLICAIKFYILTYCYIVCSCKDVTGSTTAASNVPVENEESKLAETSSLVFMPNVIIYISSNSPLNRTDLKVSCSIMPCSHHWFGTATVFSVVDEQRVRPGYWFGSML